MEHHFSVEVATEYGMLEAVLLNNIHYWIRKNEANGRNYYDDKYWTYNSAKAFHELFPYASERRIRNALKHLEDDGIIVTGNYNASAYDRTTWYALTEKGKSICRFCKMEDAKKENQADDSVRPIPNKKTVDRQIINVIEYLNRKAGTKYKSSTQGTVKLISARFADGFTEDDFRTVIDKKVKQWKGTEMEQYLRPQTLFGNKMESYLNQNIIKEKKNKTIEPPKYKQFEPEPIINSVGMPEEIRSKYDSFMKGLAKE